MMMSMFSSVSGLKAHQTSMDVIANNIANINTVGFKSSRTTFQEIFALTLSAAGAPDPGSGRGGTNPMQVGLGMNVNAIDLMMGRGSVQRTESPTDLSIEGEGFFIVRGGTEGAFCFTRAGNFTIDKLGNLVTPSGQNVYGWMKYTYGDNGYEFDTQEPLMPINLYTDIYNSNKRIIAAKVTTEAVFAGNLDATAVAIGGSSTTADNLKPNTPPDTSDIDPHFIVPFTVYDDLGNEYKVNIKMWKYHVLNGDDPQTSWYYEIDGGAKSSTGSASGYLLFDSTGKIKTDNTNFPVNVPVTFTPNNDIGAKAFEVNLNFEQLSMYADDSSVKAIRVDGYAPGTLVTFSIGSDGVITGVYDNGRQQPLGIIALATFENPAGLVKVGANQFMETTNSGTFSAGKIPGRDGAGTLVPGTLEMSNVDLAKQFTEMIITQRGFQANSRVMTTSDEILQELANIKR